MTLVAQLRERSHVRLREHSARVMWFITVEFEERSKVFCLRVNGSYVETGQHFRLGQLSEDRRVASDVEQIKIAARTIFEKYEIPMGGCFDEIDTFMIDRKAQQQAALAMRKRLEEQRRQTIEAEFVAEVW